MRVSKCECEYRKITEVCRNKAINCSYEEHESRLNETGQLQGQVKSYGTDEWCSGCNFREKEIRSLLKIDK